MEAYNIIKSGSSGNCEIYFKSIAVDMGIPFLLIKPFINDLQIVLLSHLHSDHFNVSTLKKIAFERPSLRFAIGEYMLESLQGFRNVDVCKIGTWYNYGLFKISCIKLYHDIPNIGWRIFVRQQNGEYYKIIRVSDTCHLNGIEAKNYDLYCIEHSYDEDTIQDKIKHKEYFGEYAYEKAAINSHLSEQQARDFIFKNAGENYEVLRLHETSLI